MKQRRKKKEKHEDEEEGDGEDWLNELLMAFGRKEDNPPKQNRSKIKRPPAQQQKVKPKPFPITVQGQSSKTSKKEEGWTTVTQKKRGGFASGRCFIEELPPELLFHILASTRPYTRVVCKFVCKLWHNILIQDASEVQIPSSADFVKGVCLAGEVKVFKWAIAKGCPREALDQFMSFAAVGNCIDLLEWGQLNRFVWGDAPYEAARAGSLNALKWAKAHNLSLMPVAYFKHSMQIAAEMGHLEVLLWLWDEYNNKHTHDQKWQTYARGISVSAGMGGRIEVLQWAVSVGLPIEDDVIYHAAYMNQFPVLRWLVESEHCPYFDLSEAVMLSAKAGNLDTIKWLVAYTASIKEEAKNDETNLVPLKKSQRIRQTVDIKDLDLCSVASWGGDVAMFHWAREQGCSFIKNAAACYANAHSRKMLEALKEAGCPMTEEAWHLATEMGNSDALQWLKENGCPSTEKLADTP